MTDVYIANWEQTKYITFSSFFIMIPSLYSFYHKQYFYSTMLFYTSIVSANYWRKATFSFRRDLDLAIAKISFSVFLFEGICYVRYTPYIVIGFPLILYIFYCYYLSEKLYRENNNNWYKYHCLFHFCMMFELLIILDSISRWRNSQI